MRLTHALQTAFKHVLRLLVDSVWEFNALAVEIVVCQQPSMKKPGSLQLVLFAFLFGVRRRRRIGPLHLRAGEWLMQGIRVLGLNSHFTPFALTAYLVPRGAAPTLYNGGRSTGSFRLGSWRLELWHSMWQGLCFSAIFRRSSDSVLTAGSCNGYTR
jgi:hypothetical protein